jgi:hypothetical protein
MCARIEQVLEVVQYEEKAVRTKLLIQRRMSWLRAGIVVLAMAAGAIGGATAVLILRLIG